MTELQPISTAPTDESVFIVVYKDLSGVEAIRYGHAENGGEPSWFLSDYSDEFFPIHALENECLGWFPAPKLEWAVLKS